MTVGQTTAGRTTTGLTLAGVTLRLGDGDAEVTALDDVSFSAAPGELVAVVGPSGSGKSSLLAVAGGLISPDSGEVRIDGTDLTTASRRDLARYRREQVGFVFQSGNLIPALTAIDQLRFALKVAGRPAVAGRTPSSCWTGSAWAPGPGTGRTSSPAASGSAWASPGRW